jgi:hypothetical protein
MCDWLDAGRIAAMAYSAYMVEFFAFRNTPSECDKGKTMGFAGLPAPFECAISASATRSAPYPMMMGGFYNTLTKFSDSDFAKEIDPFSARNSASDECPFRGNISSFFAPWGGHEMRVHLRYLLRSMASDGGIASGKLVGHELCYRRAYFAEDG